MSELEFWKDLGNIFDAVMNYQKKNVEFNSRFINPWIRLGNVFDRQDQANDAIRAYQNATEIDPDTAQNWVELGDAQFKNGEYNEAIEAYRKAVTLDPEAGWPLGNLALSMVTQGKIEEAIPLYKKSIDLLTEVKDKAICWNRLGNAYRKLNDYESAFHAFQTADQLDGDNTGFSDKLDETPPSVPVVASEETVEQMIVEQALEENNSETTLPEFANESAEETSQPGIESETLQITQVETADEPVALAPDMEVAVEEHAAEEEIALPLNETSVEEPANENTVIEEEASPILPEEKIDVIQVVEDVIAKIEQAFSEQKNSIANEEQPAEEIPVEGIENIAVVNEETIQEVQLAVAETVEEIQTPMVSEEATLEVEPVALEINEEVKAEVEPAALDINEEVKVEASIAGDASEEEQTEKDVPLRAPAWLVINHPVIAEEKAPVAETEAQQELAQVESVTTLSDISQETAISESAVNMDSVETYTNPLEAQLTTEPSLSASESTDQVEQVEPQTVSESQETLTVAELNPGEESAVPAESSTVEPDEQASELAYEEYLKDVTEPVNPLANHVDEIQSEAPVTKVSKNGDVRLAMDTKNANVWNELGNIYLNAGTCDDAIAAYSKAIELDRRFAWPYSNLALAYVQKGRFAEAILLYQRGIELFTSDRDKAITWNRLGNVYRRINDYDNAISSYQTADELDPENATLSLRSSFGLLGNMYTDSKPALVE
jgi:tetratricopeptide (TPR) repeat protein